MKNLGLTPDEMRAHRAENARKRYQANPEKHREIRKAYAATNREKFNEKARAYRDANRETLRSQQRAYSEANREHIRARARLNRIQLEYGIPEEAVLALLAHQNGRCAVCAHLLVRRQADADRYRKVLHVDHCHDTGKVRGLLCGRCNMAEGWIRKYSEGIKAYLAAPPATEILEMA